MDLSRSFSTVGLRKISLHPHSRSAAFTLTEMLVVVTIISILGALSVSGLRSSSSQRLTSEGELIGDFVNLARQCGLAKREAASIVIPTSGDYAYRSLAVYSQDSETGKWVQESKWHILPVNIYFDSSNTIPLSLFSSGNITPAGFLPVEISGESIAVENLRFLNFDSLGVPIDAAANPVRLRLIFGQSVGGTIIASSQAGSGNYFDLLVLNGFAGVKYARP